jgi:disulfide bond formation protein DsbB
MYLNQKHLLYGSFFIALLAMGGSLYFSEVLHQAPCVLCWYQRIAMYPIVLILLIGIRTHATDLYRYVLPLASVGLVIAFFHNLLYYGIISESLAPCTSGVSCTSPSNVLFGFVTIPLLSFISFLCICIMMWMYRKKLKLTTKTT